MVDSFILCHSPFFILPAYFIFYTIQRIIKHWKDGKERARTSTKRLVIKLIATLCCSALEIIHVVDYTPEVHYSPSDLAFRGGYFICSSISWFFSAMLVYFDYNRRLNSQWKGQRLFWILELFTNITILLMNLLVDHYEYSGSRFIQFSLIQIVIYCTTTIICGLLTYYALFRPNDFTVLPKNLYDGQSLLTAFSEPVKITNNNEISIKISYTGYKIKTVLNSSIIHYKLNVCLNESAHEISRILSDFDSLGSLLTEKFMKQDMESKIPEYPTARLRNCSTEQRGQVLCQYLTSICIIDYMIPELLNFLKIEGHNRDLLTIKHNQLLEEKLPQGRTSVRAESTFVNYFNPISHAIVTPQRFNTNSANLQWIVKVKILTHSQELSKDVDYYIKSKIPSIKFKNTKGFAIKDFTKLHKLLKKNMHPAEFVEYPSKVCKIKDEDPAEVIRAQLEHYFLEIFNDPAYLCKESLEFIGCDVEVSQLLDLLPEVVYKMNDTMTWGVEISEDSAQFIVYTLKISRKVLNGIEKEWKVSKRYKEFAALHKRLQVRNSSSYLKTFLEIKGSRDLHLPSLPGKSLGPLSSSDQIEERKAGLENYIKEILINPSVICSFAFKEFIDITS